MMIVKTLLTSIDTIIWNLSLFDMGKLYRTQLPVLWKGQGSASGLVLKLDRLKTSKSDMVEPRQCACICHTPGATQNNSWATWSVWCWGSVTFISGGFILFKEDFSLVDRHRKYGFKFISKNLGNLGGISKKNLNLPPRYQEGQCLSRQRGTRTYGSHTKALDMTWFKGRTPGNIIISIFIIRRVRLYFFTLLSTPSPPTKPKKRLDSYTTRRAKKNVVSKSKTNRFPTIDTLPRNHGESGDETAYLGTYNGIV